MTFRDSFSTNEWDLDLTHLVEHPIDTGDAAHVKQTQRRVPLAYAADEKQAIDILKAKGVIRNNTSPWASPKVLVHKKDGRVRPCVDYWKVNGIAGANRSSSDESTKLTSNLMTIGREVRLPAELIVRSTKAYDGEEITSY